VWRRFSQKREVTLPLTVTSKGEKNGVLVSDEFLQEILPRIPKSLLDSEDVQYAMTYEIRITFFKAGEEAAKDFNNAIPESG